MLGSIVILLLLIELVAGFDPIPSSDYSGDPDNRATGIRKLVDDVMAGGQLKTNVDSQYGVIEDWDVSNVLDMSKLFYQGPLNTKSFDTDLSNWDVSNVLTMDQMFYNAKNLGTDFSD